MWLCVSFSLAHYPPFFSLYVSVCVPFHRQVITEPQTKFSLPHRETRQHTSQQRVSHPDMVNTHPYLRIYPHTHSRGLNVTFTLLSFFLSLAHSYSLAFFHFSLFLSFSPYLSISYLSPFCRLSCFDCSVSRCSSYLLM